TGRRSPAATLASCKDRTRAGHASKSTEEFGMQFRNTAASPVAESAMRWLEMLADAGDALIAVDAEGQVTYANATAQLLTGRRLAAGLLLDDWVAGTPLDASVCPKEIQRVVTPTWGSQQGEFVRFRRRGGKLAA